MQSDRKFKRDKRERVNAMEYATGFLISISASADTRGEAITKAVSSANQLKEAALSKAKDPDTLGMEVKALMKTANFWANIAGHLPKVKYK